MSNNREIFFKALLTKAQLIEVYKQLDTDVNIPKKGTMAVLAGANGLVTYIKLVKSVGDFKGTMYSYELERNKQTC